MIGQKKLREDYNIHISQHIVMTPNVQYKFYAAEIIDGKCTSIYNPTVSNSEGRIIGYLYFTSFEEGLKAAIKFCNQYLKNK